MDPETKALLERSRKRRELLNQRFDNMPKASPRKRTVNDNDNNERVLAQQQSNEDDSPKRQCVRNMEQLIKPDTPAIQGVQSRIKDLATTKGIEDQENNEVPVPVPRKSISSPPLSRKALPQAASSTADSTPSSSVGRKGRFAALAQNINSWEDDISSHVHKKEEVKSSPKKTFNKGGSESPTKKVGSNFAPAAPVSEIKKVSAVNSPKKTPAPSAPRIPENNFCRSSPLRASKVELNRSPKPFLPVSETSSNSHNVTKSSSDDTIPPSKAEKVSSVISSKSCEELATKQNVQSKIPETQISRFVSSEKKAQTPKGRLSIEPSKKPMSAKLAHFEQQIVNNTPKAGLANSARVSRLQKQECTPVLSASVPAPSGPKDCDPSRLPLSQRMSRIQEKLSNSPFVKGGTSGGKSQQEPTAFPVGARMSAWETISSSSMVSDIKKVDPAEVAPVSATSNVTGDADITPPPPPPPQKVSSALAPQKSFKDSIQQRSNEIIGKRAGESHLSKSPVKKVSSPVKSIVRSPSKVVHSPSKMSKGTKVVQQQLIKKSQENSTTCGTLAAQSRAARMAELDAIQNRWKNGILKDDSSSDESKSLDKPVEKAVTPGRRQESRNKAREDFANKLSEIGFGEETVKASVASQQSTPVSKDKQIGSGSKVSTPTSSIYSLIKKRDEEQSLTVTEDIDRKKASKVTFHDSFFEDDDESMRKVPRSASLRAAQENPVVPETFKKPLTPTRKEPQHMTESDVASNFDAADSDSVTSSRTSLEIDDDDISLKGFVSEAVRRESTRMIRTPQQQYASQSSLDSYDDDDIHDKMDVGTVAGYRPDVESMDDDDDEDEEKDNPGAVGELLDEAMMDSSDASSYDPDLDPNNVVLRKKSQPPPPSNNYAATSEEDYDPDMDINNVVLRRKPRPTNTDSPVAKKTRSHAMALSTTDDDNDDDDRPYSLTAYRKSVNVNQHHMDPIVRQSKYHGQNVVEEDIPMPSTGRNRRCKDDRLAVQERIKELQELVQQEQNVIMQTSNALNKCCVGNAYFAGSAEQVECNRLLLIACQKRQVYMKEIQRLKETSVLEPSPPGPRGSLTISDIRLPLKRDFVKKIGTSHDNTTHFFILLIRNGCQVICTQMLSTHDSMMRGSLDFPNLIKINGIGGDFKLAVDIYGMSVSREMTLKDKKKKTPKKGKGFTLESPGGPTAVRTTGFSHIACVDLTMRCLDKTSFQLDRLPHLSPLYGQIFMRFKCLMESHVEEKGFLTMFDDVNGFGAWHRRWCVLSSNKLCVWKYPDDETRKDPMTMIDLKRCITEKVGLVPRDICARPNTFEMVTVRQPLKGEHDTLITKTHSTVTTVRHQMSADTKEERIMWCNKINRTLANLRTWNPDALRPTPTKQPSSSYYH